MQTPLSASQVSMTAAGPRSLAAAEHGRGMWSLVRVSPRCSQPPEFFDPHDEAGLYRNELSNLAAVIRPVAICMVLASLAVAFVRDRAFDAALESGLSTYLVFNQDATSTEGKDDGTLIGEGVLNALVIVGAIACATFVMAACIFFRLTWLLGAYILFAMTMLLGYTGGFMAYTFVLANRLPISFPTLGFLVWNFAIVGVTSIFYQRGVPRSMTQGYLICVSVIMAWTLSKFPEWTSWALLVVLALYDLCAVLTPCGPLRCIINLVQTRNVSLSGLVYEAEVSQVAPGSAVTPEHLRQQGQRDTLVTGRRPVGSGEAAGEGDAGSGSVAPSGAPGSGSGSASAPSGTVGAEAPRRASSVEPQAPEAHDEPGALEAAIGSSVKLGLGDFVFYSVLVSRAALAGLTTFAACFVAILCGLAGTIALLAVIQRALPALPISIFLGVVVFFVVRLAVVPLVILFASQGIVA